MAKDMADQVDEIKAKPKKSTRASELWYKRYPARFRRDTTHDHPMSFDLRGAWSLLTDLFYEHGGPLPNDDKWIAIQLGCDVRKWKHIRTQLEVHRKVFVGADGRLHNKTADEVLGERKDKLAKVSVAPTSQRRVALAPQRQTPASTSASTSASTGSDLSRTPNAFNDGDAANRPVRAISLLSNNLNREEDGSSGGVEPGHVADATEPPWEPFGIADGAPCVVHPFPNERAAA